VRAAARLGTTVTRLGKGSGTICEGGGMIAKGDSTIREGRRHNLGTSARFRKGGVSWWWPVLHWAIGEGGGAIGDQCESGRELGRAMGAAMREFFSVTRRREGRGRMDISQQ
jgi:hypothetical protein